MFLDSVDVLLRTACDCCGSLSTRLSIYVRDDEGPRAAALAFCYPAHDDAPSEIWIDVILGTWGTGDASDHVTFGCRYGAVEGQQEDACSLVDAARLADDAQSVFGQRLTKDEARTHPWLPDFWEVVDLLLTQVPEIGEHRARFHDRS